MDDNALALKLSGLMDLTPAERAEIEEWCRAPKLFRARQPLIRERDPADMTCLILSGWAYRYKTLRDGRRQIVGIMLPGDMCGLHGFLQLTADHTIEALSDALVALIPSRDIRASLEREPRLTFALWRSSLIDEGIAREWLLNIGQRNAVSRLAHLLCELWTRASQIGLVEDGSLLMPLTQTDMAEATGLTAVHVNRMFKSLREERLVVFKGRQFIPQNLPALMACADFDPTYLQLRHNSFDGDPQEATFR